MSFLVLRWWVPVPKNPARDSWNETMSRGAYTQLDLCRWKETRCHLLLGVPRGPVGEYALTLVGRKPVPPQFGSFPTPLSFPRFAVILRFVRCDDRPRVRSSLLSSSHHRPAGQASDKWIALLYRMRDETRTGANTGVSIRINN